MGWNGEMTKGRIVQLPAVRVTSSALRAVCVRSARGAVFCLTA